MEKQFTVYYIGGTMTGYITKALFILLVYVLLFRAYLKWAKNSPKKIKPIIAGIIAIGAGTAAVFFLTLFEVLFCLAVFCAIFIFREKLYKLYREMLSGKYGKLKAAGFTVAAVFALWLGLAVFYKTDIGIPIGVKNYLYHKYNEEFDVDGYFGVKIAGNPQNQLTCCPKNGNPQTDSFNVVRKKNLSVGSRLFASDNYYGIIIREDYEEYISTFIDDYFDDFTVKVYFETSGLSNAKYMSDELNKSTSLADFLEYQKNDNNIRGCNYAIVIITLKQQPTITEKEKTLQNANKLFKQLSKQYRLLSVYIQSTSKYNISALITHDGELKTYDVDDDFFSLQEE